MFVKGKALDYLLDFVHRMSMGKLKVQRGGFTQWRSCDGISLLANKGLYAGPINERKKFIMKGGRGHVMIFIFKTCS